PSARNHEINPGGAVTQLMTRTVSVCCSRPSLTTSWTSYAPIVSTVNVGVGLCGSEIAAALPLGADRNTHSYVNRSPSGSDDAPASSCPVAPTPARRSAPASAIGAAPGQPAAGA